MLVQTWRTWKKKNNPRLFTCQDTLGYVESIIPTLRQHGFVITTDDRDVDLTPRQDALAQINTEEVSEVVYSVWNHSQGYCSKIVVAYKEKAA
jgi:hypothetical protein